MAFARVWHLGLFEYEGPTRCLSVESNVNAESLKRSLSAALYSPRSSGSRTRDRIFCTLDPLLKPGHLRSLPLASTSQVYLTMHLELYLIMLARKTKTL